MPAEQPLTQSSFEKIARLAEQQGLAASLDFLEQQFRDQKEYFSLFEVLKMRCRTEMGLGLIYGQQPDDLTNDQQQQLEDALLQACRTVGTLLIQDGKIQEGWMYLQPVGDRELSQALIKAIEIDEDNLDSVIEIAVTQGAAPAYGYDLLLKNFGTCNAITTFDTQAPRFDVATQKTMAAQLVRHLYDELCENIRTNIESENKTIGENSLGKILDEHPRLLADGGHHIDATHLASVMRIARRVDGQEDLVMASELARYGLGLHPDFQYPGAAPFEDTYPDHQFFFDALCGKNVNDALEHFEKKCETLDTNQVGSVAYETLVDLLVRLGRNQTAVEVLTQHVLGRLEPMGIAPNVFDIAQDESELAIVKDHFRSQNDLLGYAVAVLKTIAKP